MKATVKTSLIRRCILLTAVFVMGFISFSYAQKLEEVKRERYAKPQTDSILTANKWYIDLSVLSDDRIFFYKEDKLPSYISFTKDGKFLLVLNEKDCKGKWTGKHDIVNLNIKKKPDPDAKTQVVEVELVSLGNQQIVFDDTKNRLKCFSAIQQLLESGFLSFKLDHQHKTLIAEKQEIMAPNGPM